MRLERITEEDFEDQFPNMLLIRQQPHTMKAFRKPPDKFSESGYRQGLKRICAECDLYAIWAYETDDWPIGYCYIDKESEASIMIEEFETGNGYGTAAIKAMCDKHDGPVYAMIKRDNRASIRAFGKAGFRMMGESVSPDYLRMIYEVRR
jgi:RimJ/RimL family protein N-acetyltransferase